MEPLDQRRTRPALSNLKQPLRETASQTAGPYVHIGCLPNASGVAGIFSEDLVRNRDLNETDGTAISLRGQIFDGERALAKDIMLEFWHADHTGSYATGIWGRTATDLQAGEYQFETIMPGATTDRDGSKLAPFISVMLFARGINLGLMTRIYFPHDETLLDSDPHLMHVDPIRRNTLICEPGEQTDSVSGSYIFNIRLQGEGETVFFEV